MAAAISKRPYRLRAKAMAQISRTFGPTTSRTWRAPARRGSHHNGKVKLAAMATGSKLISPNGMHPHRINTGSGCTTGTAHWAAAMTSAPPAPGRLQRFLLGQISHSLTPMAFCGCRPRQPLRAMPSGFSTGNKSEKPSIGTNTTPPLLLYPRSVAALSASWIPAIWRFCSESIRLLRR